MLASGEADAELVEGFAPLPLSSVCLVDGAALPDGMLVLKVVDCSAGPMLTSGCLSNIVDVPFRTWNLRTAKSLVRLSMRIVSSGKETNLLFQ